MRWERIRRYIVAWLGWVMESQWEVPLREMRFVLTFTHRLINIFISWIEAQQPLSCVSSSWQQWNGMEEEDEGGRRKGRKRGWIGYFGVIIQAMMWPWWMDLITEGELLVSRPAQTWINVPPLSMSPKSSIPSQPTFSPPNPSHSQKITSKFQASEPTKAPLPTLPSFLIIILSGMEYDFGISHSEMLLSYFLLCDEENNYDSPHQDSVPPLKGRDWWDEGWLYYSRAFRFHFYPD